MERWLSIYFKYYFLSHIISLIQRGDSNVARKLKQSLKLSLDVCFKNTNRNLFQSVLSMVA